MSYTETFSLAHSARCKLQMAADQPDRNLRFILGHAFTLDKLRLRLAEIEVEGSEEDDEENGDDGNDEKSLDVAKQHVSFRNSKGQHGVPHYRQRSPPPDKLADLDDTDSDSDPEDDDVEGDEEVDDELSLRRFQSASGKQPRVLDDEEDEIDNSPYMPSEDELKVITNGAGNDELAGLYQHVAGCPCHGGNAPTVSKVWELPTKAGIRGTRIAVMEVAA